MLNDAHCSKFQHVYIFVGKTALRKGLDGLANLVKQKFSLDPFQSENLSFGSLFSYLLISPYNPANLHGYCISQNRTTPLIFTGNLVGFFTL